MKLWKHKFNFTPFEIMRNKEGLIFLGLHSFNSSEIYEPPSTLEVCDDIPTQISNNHKNQYPLTNSYFSVYIINNEEYIMFEDCIFKVKSNFVKFIHWFYKLYRKLETLFIGIGGHDPQIFEKFLAMYLFEKALEKIPNSFFFFIYSTMKPLLDLTISIFVGEKNIKT